MNIAKNIKTIFFFLLLPVLAPISLLARIFRRSVEVPVVDVEKVLLRMESGRIDAYWWDDFLRTRIRDARLDAIRERCDEIWNEQSSYISLDIDGQHYLNSKGIAEIQALLQKCSYLKKEQTVHI